MIRVKGRVLRPCPSQSYGAPNANFTRLFAPKQLWVNESLSISDGNEVSKTNVLRATLVGGVRQVFLRSMIMTFDSQVFPQ